MFPRLLLAGIALMAAGSLTTSYAQRTDGLVLMGSKEIDLGKDTDVIDVSRAKGAYQHTRLILRSGNMQINNIQVRYTGGRVHNEKRDININGGERTRQIDESKDDRFVDAVALFYKPQPGRKVLAEIWGQQSAKGAGMVRTAAVAAPVAPAKPPLTQGPLATAPTAPTPTNPATAGQVMPNGEVLFGVQYVGFLRDKDVIKVGGNVGQFDRLRMRVLDNDIFINDVEVVYVGGEIVKAAVNSPIKKDSRTQWINLKGDKFIQEIRLNYRSQPSLKGQARVEVFGELSDGWLGPNGRGKQYNEGWVLLGAQTAGRFLRTETDRIPVGRNEGGFKRIRVTVRDRALILDEVRVVYGNNQEDVIPVKTKVEFGSTYGPIDLKGGSRVIREIFAKYRSAVLDAKAVGRGASVVEIWGQH